LLLLLLPGYGKAECRGSITAIRIFRSFAGRPVRCLGLGSGNLEFPAAAAPRARAAAKVVVVRAPRLLGWPRAPAGGSVCRWPEVLPPTVQAVVEQAARSGTRTPEVHHHPAVPDARAAGGEIRDSRFRDFEIQDTPTGGREKPLLGSATRLIQRLNVATWTRALTDGREERRTNPTQSAFPIDFRAVRQSKPK
jgi:hypothetical protein